MRILLVSKFLHRVGGVETYLGWLVDHLIAEGHDIALFGMQSPVGSVELSPATQRFSTTQRSYTSGALLDRATDALQSIYSISNARSMKDAIAGFKPDVVHFHGTCYQLTSSVVRAAGGAGIGRLATAHEYKLVCANQRLWADSTAELCQICVGASPAERLINPIRRRCIKSNMAASVVGGVEAAISDGIMRGADDMLIHCPSRFMEHTLHVDGWSPERTAVLDLPWRDSPHRRNSSAIDFLYMGRLAPEKDVMTVLRAWHSLGERTGNRTFVVAGTGAEEERLRRFVADAAVERVRFVGHLSTDELGATLRSTAATLHPAAWFENSPFAVRESLMSRVPALVADRGGMPELIDDQVTGAVVQHSVKGWESAILRFLDEGLGSDVQFEQSLMDRLTTEDDHYRSLMTLYDTAVRLAETTAREGA